MDATIKNIFNQRKYNAAYSTELALERKIKLPLIRVTANVDLLYYHPPEARQMTMTEMNKVMHMRSDGYNKAFGILKHNEIIRVLKHLNIDSKDLNIKTHFSNINQPEKQVIHCILFTH